ncbi:MAG: FecR domain-containing protein [Elusimicrobia bacterium]|nr:FecR domain-containing protein [Elusimicrobiota bacterium]
MRAILASSVVLLAAAASAAVPTAPAGLTGIGVAAAVRGAVSATAPGAVAGRVIGSGRPVYLNDHVTTGPGARLQILLLDETTFTIGPDADMVLDEFVYDPATGGGRVTAEISRGAFRFVTGKVARNRPADMKVKLPVGTIGIRGTIVDGYTDGREAKVVLGGPGPENNAHERPGGITVTNAAGSTSIDRSGYGTVIGPGGAPSEGFRFTPDQMADLHGRLFGGEAGGAAKAGVGAEVAGGSGSATKDSGQGAAAGGVNYQGAAGDLVAANGDASSFAAQSRNAGTGSDVAVWDQLLAVPSGTGELNFNGSYSGCQSCSTTPTAAAGTFSVVIPIDFGAQSFAGMVSGRQASLTLSGDITDTIQWNAVSFLTAAAASGGTGTPAKYAFSAADQGFSQNGGTAAGTTVSFRNADGAAAGAATIGVVYASSSLDAKVTGSVSGARTAIPPL